MRWCRYGVNPSGTSGNGSPPSGARRKGSATERYGPLTRFSGSARKSSTMFASSGRARRPEAGGEEVTQGASDFGRDDGGGS